MLHALMLAPRADRFIKRVITAGGTEFDAVILPEPRDRGLIQNNLGYRGKFHHIQLFQTALGGRVKPARGFQHVTKHVQPHRAKLAGGINIDNSAANCIIARFGHCWGLCEPHTHQPAAQRPFVNAPPDLRNEGRTRHHVAGRHGLHGRR